MRNSKLQWKMQRNAFLMHSMERLLKESNEAMCVEKHSISLSAMKKLFEVAVKIMEKMKMVLNFY